MDVIDVESLRLRHGPQPLEQQPQRPATRQHRIGRFLKGPVQLDWLASAGRAPGQALHVAVVLAFLVGVEKSSTVTLSHARLREFGVEKDAARRGLRALENLGLVLVDRLPGRSPVVTVTTVASLGDSRTFVERVSNKAGPVDNNGDGTYDA